MYVGGTYARLVYSWYRFIFRTFAVLIVVHAANEKTGRKQDLKKGAKQRKDIKTLLSLPIHLAQHRSTVEPLSLRSFPDIATLSLCCRSAVTTLSHHCRAIVELQPLRPREGINNTILNCCFYTVTPLSLLLSIGRFTRLSSQEALSG